MSKPKRPPGRPPGSGAGREYTERRAFVFTPEQIRRYEAAAAGLGVPLSEWVRSACDAWLEDAPGKR